MPYRHRFPISGRMIRALRYRVSLDVRAPEELCAGCAEPRCDAVAIAYWPDGLVQHDRACHVGCATRAVAAVAQCAPSVVVRAEIGEYRIARQDPLPGLEL